MVLPIGDDPITPEDEVVERAKRLGAPIHWLQALRGKSCLFTRDEALRILGWSR